MAKNSLSTTTPPAGWWSRKTCSGYSEEYKIEATTLMRTQSAATKLLDHLDGQQKVYSDDIATIHLRKQDALHTIEPAVDAKAK